MIAKTLQFVNRIAPAAKNSLPFPVKRWVMRAFFSSVQEFQKYPHRMWILEEMMPRIAGENPERVVFVGCAPYAFHYETVFAGKCRDYVTIDPLPGTRVWGAYHHITDYVENIPKHLTAHSVDYLILIGVFGFGPKTDEDLHRLLPSVHRVLKRGGVLVFSWNNDVSDDPIEHPDFKGLFQHVDVLGMPARKTFSTTLVIDFHQALPV